MQCYICSESCDYVHFNDISRGGKRGNCPLFDEQGTDALHLEQVKNAETAARSKVIQENGELDASLLDFKLSEKVLRDEERLKEKG